MAPTLLLSILSFAVISSFGEGRYIFLLLDSGPGQWLALDKEVSMYDIRDAWRVLVQVDVSFCFSAIAMGRRWSGQQGRIAPAEPTFDEMISS